MPVVLLASFPNSRIAVRSPTQTANAGQFIASTVSGALDRVVYADENRTYLYIWNRTNTPIWYFYLIGFVPVDPTVTPTFGVVGDLLQNSITGDLFQKTDTGLSTNWVLVAVMNYPIVGNEIATGEKSIEITSREMIVLTVNGVSYTGDIYVEHGQG